METVFVPGRKETVLGKQHRKNSVEEFEESAKKHGERKFVGRDVRWQATDREQGTSLVVA